MGRAVASVLAAGGASGVIAVGLALASASRDGTAEAPPPAPAAAAAVHCDRHAAPWGGDRHAGTRDHPVRTVRRLLRTLAPGETGCLRAGAYREDVTVRTPRVQLRPFPHAQATIVGRLWIARSAGGASAVGLRLDGRNRRRLPSPTVNAADVTFADNDVTNHRSGICFLLGSPGWGRAARTVIRGNRIHGCGQRPSTNQQHGIYVAESDDAQILDNVIYANADRGIQLFPDAQRTVIRGNIIDGNGEGIIFSGDGDSASSGTTVSGNAITHARTRADVESWYPPGSPRGRGNVVQGNCLFGGRDGTVNRSAGGFVTRGNVVADPRYRNRARGDFRIPSTSPCAKILAGSRAPAGPRRQRPVTG